MSFHEADQKEGKEVLMAQIHAGTIQCRRHPRLPANASIPWPQDQQVRYTTEKDKHTSGTPSSKESKVTTTGQVESEEFDTEYRARLLSMTSVASQPSSSWLAAGPAAGPGQCSGEVRPVHPSLRQCLEFQRA